MRMEHCRSCNAPIVWALTVPAGVPMPVDWEPVDGGNVLLKNPDGTHAWRVLARVVSVEEARATGGPTYIAHFKTCPDHTSWRRRKTQAPLF